MIETGRTGVHTDAPRLFNGKAMIVIAGLLVCVLLATTFQRNAVWHDSISVWMDAIRKNPNRARTYNNLGYEYLHMASYSDAIAMFTRALELGSHNTGSAYTHVSRGLAYLRAERKDRALEDFDLAIALDPSIADAYLYRATLYDGAGDLERAVLDYTATLLIRPEHGEALVNRGIAFGKMGRMEEAIQDFDKVILLQPDNADAYNNRGVAYQALGQLDKALEDTTRAILIAPALTQAHRNQAEVLRLQGRFAEAVGAYTTVISREPDDAGTFLERGDCYRELGLTSSMMKDYQKACELGNEAGCRAARAHVR